MKVASDSVSLVLIEQKIFLIRNQKVMLDHDLTNLYDVSTKALKQAVKRNAGRFPDDFMFVLTTGEHQILRSQFVTSRSSGWGGTRYAPMAFTEHEFAALRFQMGTSNMGHGGRRDTVRI